MLFNVRQQFLDDLNRLSRKPQEIGSSVLRILGALDQPAFGKDGDVAQCRRNRHHRGRANARNAHVLILAVVDIEIEYDIPSGIGKYVASETGRH